MQLTTETIPTYFTLAGPDNSHYTSVTNCFDMVNRNSTTLLVTVGDSWTWGQVLENRLTEVYGNQLSAMHNWDWLNLGQNGASNFFIADRVEEFGKIVKLLDYEKIIIVCIFTEVGRGFNSHHDQHLNYTDWLTQNINSADDFDKFIKMLNKNCVDRIMSVAQLNNCQLLFGSNFIDHLALPTELTVPLTWVKLLGTNCPVVAYAGQTGVQRLQAIENFLAKHQQPLFKEWYIGMIDRCNHIEEVCNTIYRRHPGADGHLRWAKYVSQYVK